MSAIGIDLGGTKIEAGLVDSHGQVLKCLHVETQKERIAEQIIELIQLLGTPSAIGIGAAGQIIKTSGEIFFAPNLNLKNYPLQALLEKQFNLPTVIVNDVRAAGFAEWKFGAARGANDMLCIFLGTGIGGACVSNGELITGYTNSALEIGHMQVDLNGPLCTCGSSGCLETYAGGWGIAKRAGKASAKEVFLSGPQKVIDEAFFALAKGIAGLVNILNPELILIGGGLAEGYKEAFPDFLKKLETDVKKFALKVAGEGLIIKPVTLGAQAGIIGAAALALENVHH